MKSLSLSLCLLAASLANAKIDSTNPHEGVIESNTQRTIKVHNKITKDMLGYKYIIMNYPSFFSIKVNNVLIPAGQTLNVPISNDTLAVQYEYEFGKRRKGSKVIEFKMPQTAKSTDLTFSWNDDWRVKLNNGVPKKRTILD